MAEEELSEWLREYENELFINEQHLKITSNSEDSIANKLVSSTLYSVPRFQDIANALAAVEPLTHPVRQIYIPEYSKLGRNTLSKVDSYTMKVKNNSKGMIDDGYKWRKYGQKSIKNSPNPRSYYKCTNPICNAKKQVERSMDEPNTYIITYDGFHLHFIYPFFLPNETNWPNKKPKILKHDAQYKAHFEINQESQTQEENKQAQLSKPAHQNNLTYESPEHTPANFDSELFFPVDDYRRSQGLLEDVVAPAMKNIPTRDSVLAPSWSSLSTDTFSSCSSSRTSSPCFSLSSLCWSSKFNDGFSDEILE